MALADLISPVCETLRPPLLGRQLRVPSSSSLSFCFVGDKVSCSLGWSSTDCVAEGGLESLIPLPPPPQPWDGRQVRPCSAKPGLDEIKTPGRQSFKSQFQCRDRDSVIPPHAGLGFEDTLPGNGLHAGVLGHTEIA